MRVRLENVKDRVGMPARWRATYTNEAGRNYFLYFETLDEARVVLRELTGLVKDAV